ncbi:MAG: pyridoxamine 5'-phosphate oxidase family protein [Aeromicrobium sp.]
MTTSQEKPRALATLSEEECRALLDTTSVGHIAFVNHEGQQLIPLNFAHIDGAIYFRTQHERILSQLAGGHGDVAFGIDHHDVFRQGWNVTIKGAAAEVEDRATINLVLGHSKLRPWAGGTRPLIIRVTIRSIAGRRVSGNTT